MRLHRTHGWAPLHDNRMACTSGRERKTPPTPQICALRLSLLFARSFVKHTACFLRVRCHAGSGGLPHNPVKKPAMTLASQVGKPGVERASPWLKVAQQGSAGWTGSWHYLQPPTWRRHAGLLLSSAPPRRHTCMSSTFQSPRVAQGSGGATQPVAGVPF